MNSSLIAFLYLFNDPLYDKPTKTTENQQKDLIKQLNLQANLIQAEQVQVSQIIALRDLGSFILMSEKTPEILAQESLNIKLRRGLV